LIEASERQEAVRVGVRLELVTVGWMAVEAVLAIGAGIVARSVLLTAFGFDSVIELISGGVLLWRLSSEARGASTERMESVERRATRISAVLLVLLCAYVVLVGFGGLVAKLRPEASALGVGVAAVAVLVMPLLAWRKRRANLVIGSPALRADVAETITCAYLAAATLVGAGLNLVAGWWWAEYVAALLLLVFIAMETKEAIESAIPSPRRGEG
jgi:divalent metal cation (Fe/Co/Zn/Cd) transporter